MNKYSVSSRWVRKVVENHPGPGAIVAAHLRAQGLSGKRLLICVRAWAVRHGVPLENVESFLPTDEPR